MSSKASRLFFKYFYGINHLFGFVFVNINLPEKRATTSLWKLLQALLWIILFIINFDYACKRSYDGFEEIYFIEETVSDTIILEVVVTYVMVILIMFIQFKNIKISLELFTKLLKLTNVDGFVYKAFDNQIGRQMCFFAALNELGIIFLFVLNLYWMQRKESIFSLHPFRNAIINTGLIVLPVSVVSHFSFFFTFCIDVIRQFVIFLNNKIVEALKHANGIDDFSNLAKEINDIEQIYGTTMNIIKLFERNYGWIIVILQCVCMVIGINQVNYSFFIYQLKL